MVDVERFGGAKESTYEYDYAMGGVDEVPTPLHTFKQLKIQYNQRLKDPYGCTWYAVMTCIANNRGVERTDAEFIYMRTNAYKYGFVSGEGMYLSKAGDMVVDYLNSKHPEQQWKKKAISINDEGKGYMDMGYLLHMGSHINKVYTQDCIDGLINKPRGGIGEGHSRSTSNIDTWSSIVENYSGVLPHNVIDLWSWQGLMDAKQLYPQAFIYYPSHKMPIEITVPYIKPSEVKDPNDRETITAWEKYAHEGMRLYYSNYLGAVSGLAKMCIDIQKHREIS